MRNWAIGFLVAALLAILSPQVEAQKKYEEIKPVSAGGNAILFIKNKKITYFGFDKTNPLGIKVKGPRILKILTRLDFTAKMGTREGYTIILFEKKKKIKTFYKKSKRSKQAAYPGIKGVIPGQKGVLKFKVPAGIHEYELWLANTNAPGARARLFVRSPRKKIKRVSMSPREYVSAVRLFVKEKGYDYYMVTSGKPIKLEVEGTARLKIFSRLNYDHKMRGKQVYTIQVREGKREVKRVKFRTTKSQKVVYDKESPLIVSVADKFFLKVPEGKHLFEFRLIGGKSAVLKFLIPEKNLLKRR